MNKLRLLFAAIALMPLMSFAAPTCPIGKNESELDIHRVMRNFGKYYSPTESIVSNLKGPWGTTEPTDAELKAAIDGLETMIACAEAVLANPNAEAVLPSKGSLITDEAQRKDLYDTYIYFMEDFRDALKEYRDLLNQTLVKKPAERDYAAIIAKNDDINKRIDHAHKKL